MSVSIKTIALDSFSSELVKKSSTSGVLYTISPTKNSIVPVPPMSAQTLLFSLENLSELVSVVRTYSTDLESQFQVPLGPNQIFDLYLPYAEDWVFSTETELKLSSIKSIQYAPGDADYDRYGPPAPSIKVTSSETLQLDRSSNYLTTGYCNIYLPKLSKSDYLKLTIESPEIVWRFFDTRIRMRHSGELFLPGNKVPDVISFGSSAQSKVGIEIWAHRKVDPKYVAPEAALWTLENSYANS